jgi:hypothetical protein
MHGGQEHQGRDGGTGALWKASCEAPALRRNRNAKAKEEQNHQGGTESPRRNHHKNGGKQQPTTSKKRSLRQGLRNISTEDGAKEVLCRAPRKFCAEHQG